MIVLTALITVSVRVSILCSKPMFCKISINLSPTVACYCTLYNNRIYLLTHFIKTILSPQGKTLYFVLKVNKLNETKEFAKTGWILILIKDFENTEEITNPSTFATINWRPLMDFATKH